MEWLKQLLENAEIKDNKLDIDKVIESVKKESENHVVTKTEFTNIQSQLNTANTTIEDLKKSNTDNAALQAKVQAHETTIQDLKDNHSKELSDVTKISAVKEKLLSEGAKHVDLLISKFDIEKLSINDDKSINGIDEQFKTMKETYSDMFGGASPYIYTPKDGGNDGSASADFVSIIQENQSKR